MSVYEFAHPIDKPIVNKDAIASQDPRVLDWDTHYLPDTEAGGMKVALDIHGRNFGNPNVTAPLEDFINFSHGVPVRQNKSRIVEVQPNILPLSGSRLMHDITAQHTMIIDSVLERTNFGIIKLPLPWVYPKALESYMASIEAAAAGEKAVVFDLAQRGLPVMSTHEQVPRRILDSTAVGGVILAGTPAKAIYDSFGDVWAIESIQTPTRSPDNLGEWHGMVLAASAELPLAA